MQRQTTPQDHQKRINKAFLALGLSFLAQYLADQNESINQQNKKVPTKTRRENSNVIVYDYCPKCHCYCDVNHHCQKSLTNG